MSHADLAALLHSYGYGFVFLLILLESTGLPLPGETVMIAAALYAARTHHLAPLPLVAAAASGSIAGGTLGYLLGRRLGTRLIQRFGPRIGLTENRRLLGQYLMQRNGIALVIAARFITILRPLAALLAGANRMGWQRFTLANIVGGAAWTSLYCLGTYSLGRALLAMAGFIGVVAGIAAVVAVAGGLLFVRSHEQRLTARALRARDAGEL